MKNLKNKFEALRNKAKENKGFTLVELIVVIVILAILIGVSVSGYTKYIGQSRLNTDIQNAETIRSAVLNAQSEDGVYEELIGATKGDTVTVTVTSEKTEVKAAGTKLTDSGKYATAIKTALGSDYANIKTQYDGGSFTVTATVPDTPDGSVTVKLEGNDKYPESSILYKK